MGGCTTDLYIDLYYTCTLAMNFAQSLYAKHHYIILSTSNFQQLQVSPSHPNDVSIAASSKVHNSQNIPIGVIMDCFAASWIHDCTENIQGVNYSQCSPKLYNFFQYYIHGQATCSSMCLFSIVTVVYKQGTPFFWGGGLNVSFAPDLCELDIILSKKYIVVWLFIFTTQINTKVPKKMAELGICLVFFYYFY